MRIELTDDEREFIHDKAFWEKAYLDIDRHAARTEEAKEFFEAEYKFYDNLCNKMKGNDGEKGLQSRED